MMKRLFAVAALSALIGSLSAGAQTPREALAQVRVRLDGLSSYHLHLEDQTEPTDIDYTAPQRMRITKPGSVGIIVGGGVYLNVGGAGWTPAGVNTALAVLMATLADDQLINFTNDDEITDQGSDVLGGVAMHKYEIRTPVNGSFLRRVVWVGAKDGLPYRVERNGGTSQLTATYSEFNKNFGIEVPPGMQPAAQP
jgi:outer membrane lipoprotein-sorting protein